MHSAQTLVAADSLYASTNIIYSALDIEVNTEERASRPGQRSQVDFTMSAHTCNSEGRPVGEALYCIPVEVKGRLMPKHMAQIGQNQAMLSSGIYMKNVGVGI